MRIAIVLTRADSIGGAQIHVRDLGRHLAQADHDVRVFVGGRGPLLDLLDQAEISYRVIPHLVHPISPLSDLSAIRELHGALKAFQPDLVTAHSTKAGLLARLAARRLDVPSVFTAHGWAFTADTSPLTKRLYRAAEWLVAPLTRRIICVSEYDRQLALAGSVGTTGQLRTVHNGVPDTPFRASPEAQPARLVMVGRMAAQKDHELLFHALKDLPAVHLDLVGDGPKEETLRSLARTLGISERVHFLGSTNQVAQMIARAQLFVLTTHYEGLPLSILEAMQTGLPVIATDVGGVKEAVIDGETGYVVPRGNLALLRERLSALVDDPERRRSMGAAGRRRYVEHFTLPAMVEKTLAVYREILPEAASEANLVSHYLKERA